MGYPMPVRQCSRKDFEARLFRRVAAHYVARTADDKWIVALMDPSRHCRTCYLVDGDSFADAEREVRRLEERYGG